MSTDSQTKCVSEGFTTEQFYLIQSNGVDNRFIVSLRNPNDILYMLNSFIEKAQHELQVRVRDLDDSENPIDFDGQVKKEDLIKAITRYHNALFHNGYFDLMIRHPETGDYIVFDEHGLIFIYSQEDFSVFLDSLQIPFNPDEKLPYEYGHWHYKSEEGSAELQQLIKDLDLK